MSTLSACEAEVLLHRLDAGDCISEALGDAFDPDLIERRCTEIANSIRIGGTLPHCHDDLTAEILADCVDGSTWHLTVPWDRGGPLARKQRRVRAALLRKLRAWGLPDDVEFPA